MTKIFKSYSVQSLLLLLIVLLWVSQSHAMQTKCPDTFLKNAYFLMKQKKVPEALETFNQIVKNFYDCPMAEEAQFQMVLFYSKNARRTNNVEYHHLAKEHINFYLANWPNGGYRSSVLREREFNRESLKPFILDRAHFFTLLVIAIGSTLALGLATL